MGMTATARRVGNTLKHEVDVNGRHVIVTDEPERLGGTDEGARTARAPCRNARLMRSDDDRDVCTEQRLGRR